MRRNIAKVSALIMAATTAMSPMMPAATTVAWASESKAEIGTVVDGSVKWLTDKIDWNAATVTAQIEYEREGMEGTYTATATVSEYYFKKGAAHGSGNTALFAVTDGLLKGTTQSIDVPEGTTHYETTSHKFVQKVEWGKYNDNGVWEKVEGLTGASCETGAVKKTYNVCEADNTVEKDSTKYEEVKALGHKFDAKTIYKDGYVADVDNEYFANVKIKEDGTVEVKDVTKDAVYSTVEMCTVCGYEHIEQVEIKATEAKSFQYVCKENTELDKDNKPVLVDHTKPGTYEIQYYDGNGNEMVGLKKTVTIEAGHTWGDFTLQYPKTTANPDGYDGYDKDTKDLFAEGKISYEIKDGEVVVKNSDCYRTATVRLVQTCTKASDNKIVNEKTVKTVTVKPTGRHNYSEKKGESVASEDGKTHITSVYKECVECGDRVELESTTVDHYKKDGSIAVETKTRTENEVKATCGKGGSMDVVTYCADCGYVFKTETKTTPATGDHKEWAAPELELAGNYVIYYEGKGVEVNVHQHCVECGEERFQDEDGNTTLTVNVDGPKQNYTVWDTVDGKEVKLEVKTSKVEASKYECTPDTIKVEAVYSVDGKQVLKEEKVVPYFLDKLEYNTQKDHVAGTPVTEKREDGTYKVTYCKYGCGTEMSAEKVEAEKTLGQVEGLKATAKADGQVEVSWDALEGADGYLVVAINGKVRGQQIGYTAGTSFVDKDANSKDYNYYWVIPYFKNADGKIVKGQLTGYVYAMKQTEFAAVAESTEDGVALTWEAVEGASKYIVKAKAASEKTATAIATVTGTEYVDATASADEYTFYWVFPVYTNAAGKDVVGNASNYVFGMTK